MSKATKRRTAKASPTPAPTPAPSSITCPNCGAGLPAVVWQEWIPSTRPITGIDGNTIHVSDDYTDNAEGATDDGLACTACGHDWPIPEGLTVDHG